LGISFRTYAQLALEDAEGRWELVGGSTRRKPPESFQHGAVIDSLVEQLVPQLSGTMFRMSINHARVMIDPHHILMPDLMVVPRAVSARAVKERPNALEAYHTSLPLVIDVWSPATAEFNVDARIPEYRRANVEEIWVVHPAARAVTTWVRRASGVYEEVIRAGGILAAARVPDLALDLNVLFS
jgi:Uma2 family endonuclease